MLTLRDHMKQYMRDLAHGRLYGPRYGDALVRGTQPHAPQGFYPQDEYVPPNGVQMMDLYAPYEPGFRQPGPAEVLGRVPEPQPVPERDQLVFCGQTIPEEVARSYRHEIQGAINVLSVESRHEIDAMFEPQEADPDDPFQPNYDLPSSVSLGEPRTSPAMADSSNPERVNSSQQEFTAPPIAPSAAEGAGYISAYEQPMDPAQEVASLEATVDQEFGGAMSEPEPYDPMMMGPDPLMM